MTGRVRAASAAPEPRYRQILQDLRTAIEAGSLRPGSLAPSEKALEAHYGVSRITARRALDELAQSRMIERSRGRRARVLGLPAPEALPVVRDDLANMLRQVRGTTVSVLDFEWRVATPEIAHALMVDEGDQVLFVARLRRRAERPVFVTHVYLPRPVGQLIDRKMLETTPILDVMAAQGVDIARYDQRMSARPCPEWVAPLLQLEAGDPTFQVTRTVRDRHGCPVQLVTIYFRWDAYSYRFSAVCDGDEASGTIETARPASDPDQR